MKTIIKIFICLSLIYTPMFANAANVGGWSLGNPVSKGASVIYDATKNVVINGKDFVKDSWVKITPNATQVAKVLARGAAGYALSVAVEQLLGSVDWVLDPANNQIRYREQPSDPSLNPNFQYRCTNGSIVNTTRECGQATLSNPPAHIAGATSVVNCSVPTKVNQDFACTYKWPDGYQSSYLAGRSVTRVEALPEEEEKILPLPVVAQKVISNAEGGDAAAQQATTAAAADIVAEAENDNTKARPIASQAEANATTKPADAAEAEKANEAQGQTKPNEANPDAMDISLEFPVFCSWAPIVCEAAQVVISFPQTLTGWWESANQRADEWETSISQAYHDFMRDDELPNDDTKVDITEHPVPELKEDAISWVSSCPADEYVPISLQGVTSTLVLSWSPWCQLLSIIKPAIIASAYIGAAFIVLGIRT